MKTLLFNETQFMSRAMKLFISSVVVLPTAIVPVAYWLQQRSPDAEFWIVMGMLMAVNLFLLWSLLTTRLVTEVSESEIRYRYFPFHFSMRSITWSQVKNAFVRQYSPLGEYGGWGIRKKLFKNDWVYNISGKEGLQLELKDGSKVLIGTQKPEELQTVVKNLIGS